jgi:hypothetical protein
LDVSDNGHSQQLKQRLGALPAQDTARAVSKRMPAVKDEWGGVHLATIAGELRLVDTIPMLIDRLDDDAGDPSVSRPRERLSRSEHRRSWH